MLRWEWNIEIPAKLGDFYNNPIHYTRKAFASTSVKRKIEDSLVDMLSSSFLPTLAKTFEETDEVQKVLGKLEDIRIIELDAYTEVDAHFNGVRQLTVSSSDYYLIILLKGTKFKVLLSFTNWKELELNITGYIKVYWDWSREIRKEGYKLEDVVQITPKWVRGVYLYINKVYAEALGVRPTLLLDYYYDWGISLVWEGDVKDVSKAIVDVCADYIAVAHNRWLLNYFTDWRFYLLSMLPRTLEGSVTIERTPLQEINYIVTVDKKVIEDDMYYWRGRENEELGARFSIPLLIEMLETKRRMKLRPWGATLGINVVMRLSSAGGWQSKLCLDFGLYLTNVPSADLGGGWKVSSMQQTSTEYYTLMEHNISDEEQQIDLPPPHRLLDYSRFEEMLHEFLRKMFNSLLYKVT